METVSRSISEDLELLDPIRSEGTYFLNGNMAIENNQHGAEDVPHSQIVYVPKSSSKPEAIVAGWKWNYPKTEIQSINDRVKAYPEIVFGRKPWANGSNNPILPAAIKDLLPSGLKLDVKFRIRSEGKLNVAAECWLCKRAESGPDEIVAEIMFWFATSLAVPHGQKIASVNGVEVWQGNMNGNWKYFAFVYDTLPDTIQISSCLNWLAGYGHIDKESYLLSVEFGTEIWYGQGEVAIDSIALSL